MKLKLSRRQEEQGSLLLVALMVAGIAGVTLGSYLMMTQTQNVSIHRSQTWNTVLVTGEAGVEDGLQLINRYAGTLEPSQLFRWTNTATYEGWSNPYGSTYYIRRNIEETVSSGTVTNWYEVWIFNTNNEPAVLAVGHVPSGYLASASTAQPLLATIGPLVATPTAQPTINRKIFVKTRYDPLFVVAMAATDRINLNGNNINTDSFDSSNPLYSNNGFYPYGNPSRTRDHGDVATDLAVIDALNLGNANIRGRVRTGPGTNTIYIGANGSVGDRAWVTGGTHGIQEGYSATDFNVAFPTVSYPDVSDWMTPNHSDVTISNVHYQYVIDEPGDYFIPYPGLTSSLYIDVPTNELVRIKMNYSTSLGGNDVIRIAPTGARVRMYTAGPSFTLSGGAFIDNMSGFAQNFYLFGLPTCRTISWGGNANFYGGIYAPQADFSLGGGGNDWWDFVGASVTRTVTMTGHYRFHFDENLAKIGPSRGFIPVAWQEL